MRALRAIVIALGLLLVAITAYAIARRIAYPFELEWMEGEMVVHVARVLQGQPLYVAPGLSFVPFAYPPLFYYACVPLAWISGPGFLPLRVVSIFFTLVSAGGIAAVVRPASGRVAALAACAAFAAAYAASDAWFDLGRVDAMYVALLAACYASAVRAKTRHGWALAGLFAYLAFMTKQPALVAVAPLVAYLLLSDRPAALWFCGTFTVLSGVTILVAQIVTGGWYWYYVFELPRLRLGVSPRSGRLLSFWTSDLLPFVPGLVAGTIVIVRRGEWRHLALASGLILSAWLSRLEGGAWNNTVMPAYLAAAILLGLALRRDASRPLLAHGVVAIQLVLLLYDPRPFIPTTQHRADGVAFLETLRTIDGSVLILDHGFWATRSGRPEFAHGWAVTDVVWADRGEAGRRLEQEIREAISGQGFAAIVLDDERSWFFRDVENNYESAGQIRAPAPLSGALRHPRYVYTK